MTWPRCVSQHSCLVGVRNHVWKLFRHFSWLSVVKFFFYMFSFETTKLYSFSRKRNAQTDFSKQFHWHKNLKGCMWSGVWKRISLLTIRECKIRFAILNSWNNLQLNVNLWNATKTGKEVPQKKKWLSKLFSVKMLFLPVPLNINITDRQLN